MAAQGEQRRDTGLSRISESVDTTHPSPSIVDNVNVVIISDDETQRRLYVLPSHTSIGAVRQRYTADVGLDMEGRGFIDESESSIADDRSLAEISGDGPGRQVVVLTFDHMFRLEVEDVWKRLSVTLNVFPTDQWQEVVIKMVAAIVKAAKERLQAEENEDSQSDVDEESPPLPSHPTVGEVRLFHGEQRLVLRGSVLEALVQCGAPRQRRFHLRLERQRMVVVTKGSKPSVRQVWPTDVVGELSGGRAAWSGDRVVQHQANMLDIDLLEEGIIVTDPLILTLQVLEGENMTVRAPKWATVGDLRRVARSLSSNPQVHLRRDKTILDDDHLSLQQAGLVEQPLLIVDTDIKTLNIEELTWCPRKRSLTFDDLIHDIMQMSGASETCLKRRVFACVGCGRRMWKDEASIQMLPLKCCAVESQKLTEWTPPRKDKWDAAEMAAKWEKIKEAEELKRQTESLQAQFSNMEEKIGQLEFEIRTLKIQLKRQEICIHQLSKNEEELLQQCSQLEKENEDMKTVLAMEIRENNKIATKVSGLKQNLKQQEELMAEILQQKDWTCLQEQLEKRTHDGSGATGEAARDAKLENVNFFIANNCDDFNDKLNFSVTLSLSPTPTIGEIRAAIARHMGRRPERTRLLRRVATSDGVEMFLVGGGHIYADAAGNVRRPIKDEEWKVLKNDVDPFTVAKGCLNDLLVDQF